MEVKHSLFAECQMVLPDCMQYLKVSCRLPGLRIELEKKERVSVLGKPGNSCNALRKQNMSCMIKGNEAQSKQDSYCAYLDQAS